MIFQTKFYSCVTKKAGLLKIVLYFLWKKSTILTGDIYADNRVKQETNQKCSMIRLLRHQSCGKRLVTVLHLEHAIFSSMSFRFLNVIYSKLVEITQKTIPYQFNCQTFIIQCWQDYFQPTTSITACVCSRSVVFMISKFNQFPIENTINPKQCIMHRASLSQAINTRINEISPSRPKLNQVLGGLD